MALTKTQTSELLSTAESDVLTLTSIRDRIAVLDTIGGFAKPGDPARQTFSFRPLSVKETAALLNALINISQARIDAYRAQIAAMG